MAWCIYTLVPGTICPRFLLEGKDAFNVHESRKSGLGAREEPYLNCLKEPEPLLRITAPALDPAPDPYYAKIDNSFNFYFLYLLKSKNIFRVNTTYVRVGTGSGAGARAIIRI
jgi:hypothetical protein